MGSVPNVGLMKNRRICSAHDKTFQMTGAAWCALNTIRYYLMEQTVEKDILENVSNQGCSLFKTG
jgi:monomeric isocitrate dehydrogenase